ncbi:MAG: hypothetical protein FJZ13_02245 [Candidatus Omnitrophica bacterium]|nr:hypothetical protein [Candidatus Omnitrophota bacterium]
MLKALRNKKTAKKIWIVLAIIIVPPFVLWGLGGALRSQEESASAGRLFGRNISVLDYQDALEAVKNQAIMLYGENFSQESKYLDLAGEAWNRLILLREVKKRKIKASDKEVVNMVRQYPFFQRNGKFDNRLYAETLRYIFRTQPRAFEEQTRQNIMFSKLYNRLTLNIKVSDEEIRQEYAKLNEEISLNYLASLPAEFQKDISPTEEQLKDYFNKNSFEFKQPPSFDVEYVTMDSEDKVKTMASRLNKKADFSRIAKESGAEVKVTGLFSQGGAIPGIGWSPQIADLVSKLKTGQFTAPIRLDKNYYILRLKDKKEAYIPDFEKIKDKVRQSLVKNEAAKIAKQKIEECFKNMEELSKKNPKEIGLANLAATFQLKSGSTDLFKYGSYIEGIGGSDSFWLAANGLKEGAFSNIIQMPSGFYIIKLKNKVPIDEKKFESQKSEFAKNLLIRKKEESFSKFVEELRKKAFGL